VTLKQLSTPVFNQQLITHIELMPKKVD
jgi:hypothetical protein